MTATTPEPGPWSKYARFFAKCDAANILAKVKYDPVSVFATSKIDPLPYQLEDFLSLADHMKTGEGLHDLLSYETGLGKTVVAGLLMKELLLTASGHKPRILVVATPMGVAQWAREMEEKFGLRFKVYRDDDDVREDLLIASMDTMKSQRRLERLMSMEPQWDMVVVDEFHRATPGNKRYEMLEWLRGRARHFLALTATPHDGKHDHFIGRLRLIDPTVNDSNFKDFLLMHNYRRLKREVEGIDGSRLFPYPVSVMRVDVPVSEGEAAFYAAVEGYVRMQYNLAFRRGKDVRYGLVATVMGRMASSSVRAGVDALRRRRDRLLMRASARVEEPEEVLGLLEEYSRGELDVEFEEIANRVIEGLAPEEGELVEQELEAINDIIERGESVLRGQEDSKLRRLKEIIEAHRGSKVVVFTSFVETANYLHESIPGSYIVTGKIDEDERRLSIEEFLGKEGGGVLIGTEVIGESLNLQRANVLVNYEIPWSPIALVQRIGRIYRYPQRSMIYVYNFSSQLRVERRVIDVLYDKIDRLVREFDEGSVEIIGSEIAEENVEELVAKAYVEGEEAARRAMEADAEKAMRHAEELREVLNITEAGRRHVNASFLLKNPAELITADDLVRFLEGAVHAGIGDGNPRASPPYFRVGPLIMKSMSVDDECVNEALRRAYELPIESVALLSDFDDEGVVHEIEYVDARGDVLHKEVVLSTASGKVYPYHVLLDSRPVDVSAEGVSAAPIAEAAEDRMKAVRERLREWALFMGERIEEDMRKVEEGGEAEYIKYIRMNELRRRKEEIADILRGGVSTRVGAVLGYVKLVSAGTAYAQTGRDEYNPKLLEHRRRIEMAAMEYVIEHERREGWDVEDVHEMNLGYDLMSRKGAEVRYIEVKGVSDPERNEVTLTENEMKASGYFNRSFYLYVVKDPLGSPSLVVRRPPFKVKGVVQVLEYLIDVGG